MGNERKQRVMLCPASPLTCDWAVAGSDEDEMLASASEHARRSHGIELSLEQLREQIYELREPVRERIRGI